MTLLIAPATHTVDLEDKKQLRAAFGTFPTGVTVVTVGGGAPRGMTANSFTSVSLEPPLILICVGKDAIMHSSLDQSPTFSVSVLAAGQEYVARHFADRSRPMGAEQFDAVGWLPGRAGDAPLIAGAVTHFECERWQSYDGGDHTLFLGKVLAADYQPKRDSVLFHKGTFRQAPPEPAKGTAA
ncbi:flavin reductase family protein [Streptomyces sp. O3]